MEMNFTETVPADWLLSVLRLLTEMAREGATMVDCDDPADLMTDIAWHLGVQEEDDLWDAAVLKIKGRVSP